MVLAVPHGQQCELPFGVHQGPSGPKGVRSLPDEINIGFYGKGGEEGGCVGGGL